MRKLFIFILLSAVFLLQPIILLAQADTLFWFVAPRATGNHEAAYPVTLRISSFDDAATIVIDLPAYPALTPIKRTVAANSMQTISLDGLKSYIENNQVDKILQKGIRIRSTNGKPVTVYYEIGTARNGEIFSLKGSNALGTDFYVPSTLTYNNDNVYDKNYYQWDAWSGVDVVATEDGTTVNIELANDAGPVLSATKQASYKRYGGCCPTMGDWSDAGCNNYWEPIYEATGTFTSPDGMNWTLTSETITTTYKTPGMCPQHYEVYGAAEDAFQDQAIISQTINSKYKAGQTITVTLKKGETYNVRAASKIAGQHLGGSHITSNKPIAVTVNEDTDNIDVCYDILGDQIVPTNIVGKEYIAVIGETVNGEVLVMVGTKDGTSVTYYDINQTAQTITLDAGEVKEIKFPGDGTNTGKGIYVKATEPIYVYQVTSMETCEAGSALLPSIVCTGSSEVAINRNQIGSFAIVLLTRTANKSGFTYSVDGGAQKTINASNFNYVPGTNNEWVAARITYANREIPVGKQVIVSNTIGIFHLGVANGYPVCVSGYCPNLCTYSNGVVDTCVTVGTSQTPYYAGTGTYGYFSNFGVAKSSTSSETRYSGCQIALDAPAGSPKYLWNNGDTTSRVFLNSLTSDTTVWVLTNGVGCNDTTYYNIHPTLPKAGLDTSFCVSTSIPLDVSKELYDSLVWVKGPDIYTSDSIVATDTIFSKSPQFTFAESDTIAVIFYYKGCASPKNYFKIRLERYPIVNLPADTIMCLGDSLFVVIDTNGMSHLTFNWSTGSTNDTVLLKPTSGGIFNYTVTVTNKCGFATVDNMKITILAPTVTTTTNDIYADCQASLTAPSGYPKYTWSHTTTNDSIVNVLITSTVQTIKVYYNNNKCTSDTSIFKIIPLEPKAGKTLDLCVGNNIEIDVSDQKADSVQWFKDGTSTLLYNTKKVNLNQSGKYYVQFYYKGCASSKFFYNVAVVEDPKVNITNASPICIDNLAEGFVTLVATVVPDSTPLKWSTDDTSKSIKVTAAGEYTVTATNKCNITDVKSAKVENCPIVVPNAFTPNGDGINDIFWITDVDKSVWQVVIYNRWGRKVFETDHYLNTPTDGWTGENHSDGVYYWVITNMLTGKRYDNGKDGTGYVHVIREEK